MNHYRLLLLALLTTTFLAFGCGDGGGSGGDSADSVCSACDVQTAAAITACQEFYNICRVDDAGTPEDCAVGARQRCGA